MDNPGWYLIAYDIVDQRRRQRLHRRLRREAIALQESVFLVQQTQAGIATLLDTLTGLMHRREDDLRAYPIPGPGELWLRGKGAMDGSLLQTAGRNRPDQRPPAATQPARGGWWRRLIGGGHPPAATATTDQDSGTTRR
jgi:CRISPR-associated endonuclease Cas2